MNKKLLLLFLAVLALGFSLRVKGLFTGLPSQTGRLSTYHFDEYITFGALGAMEPARLDLFPGEALYWGTFQVYLQGAVLKGMQLTGLFRGGDKAYMAENLRMADRMYVSGRLIPIFFSSLSIVLLFLISLRLLSGYFALLPPLFLALSYVEIYMATLVKPDSIMLFWGLCSFYFCLKILRGEGGTGTTLLAGVFNGFSFVTKYTGLVFGFNYSAAAAYRAVRERTPAKWLRNLALYVLALAVVFILINPYFILRNAETLVYMKAVFAKAGVSAGILGAYREYFFQVLPASFGWPAAALGLLSTGYALAGGNSREMRLAAAFSVVYLVKFGSAASPVFTYSLPLAPFFALTTAWLIERKFSGSRTALALAAVIFIYTAAYSTWHKAMWSDTNTLTRASAWLETLPPGTGVCVSKVEVWTPPALRRYHPALRVVAASESSSVLSESLTALEGILGGCDYAVVGEFEERELAADPELFRVGQALSDKFSVAAEFRRPRPWWFVTSDSHHYQGANFMNPDVYILKKKDGLSGVGQGLTHTASTDFPKR
jgi:4-amino-4-deoxy-L-arabinose transferase-like glycosyltransferase